MRILNSVLISISLIALVHGCKYITFNSGSY